MKFNNENITAKIVSFITTSMFLPTIINAQPNLPDFKELADQVQALSDQFDINDPQQDPTDPNGHIPSLILPIPEKNITPSEDNIIFTENSCRLSSLLQWLHQNNIQILLQQYGSKAKSEYLLHEPEVNESEDCDILFRYRFKVNNLLNKK